MPCVAVMRLPLINMQKQLLSWQFIQKSIRQHIPVILLYVLESKGSSPGRQGFMMAVNAAGEICGSIGGGIMEHKFVELAKARLINPTVAISIHLQQHDKLSAKKQSGMICSGEQTIFLYTVSPNDLASITALVSSLETNINGCLQLSPAGISFSPDIPATDFNLVISSEQEFVYTEKTGYKNRLSIIGGGHVALAFSRLMSGLDFYIELFDHRRGLNTIEQNSFAHRIQWVEDYQELDKLITPGLQQYVVIMTLGYRTDSDALKSLLGKSFKYLGVLGSSYKVAKLINDLEQQGFQGKALNTIYAPVGLPIKSQTPEEIAISIAAEIIQVKNQDLK
jgi:xanthine dehydrogenase accessory factor